ncbi:uncharacterized protein LOC143250659 isoform X2 [Tachypleus tridentatus]
MTSMYCLLYFSIVSCFLQVTCETQQTSNEETWRPLVKVHSREPENQINKNTKQSKVFFDSEYLKYPEKGSDSNDSILFEEEPHLLVSASDNLGWRLRYLSNNQGTRKQTEAKHVSKKNREENLKALQVLNNEYKNIKVSSEFNSQEASQWLKENQRPVFTFGNVHQSHQRGLKSSNNIPILVLDGSLSEGFHVPEERSANVDSLGKVLESFLQNIPRKEQRNEGQKANYVKTFDSSPLGSSEKLPYPQITLTKPPKHSTLKNSPQLPPFSDQYVQPLVIEIPLLTVGSTPYIKPGEFVNLNPSRSELGVQNLGGSSLPVSQEVIQEILSLVVPEEHTVDAHPTEASHGTVNSHVSQRGVSVYAFQDGGQKRSRPPIAIHSEHKQIPSTNFRCQDHKVPGYYANVETGCQVFHVCEPNKRQHNLMCPPGTLFSQSLLICDWSHKVQCERSADFFHVNNNVYKPRHSSKNIY